MGQRDDSEQPPRYAGWPACLANLQSDVPLFHQTHCYKRRARSKSKSQSSQQTSLIISHSKQLSTLASQLFQQKKMSSLPSTFKAWVIPSAGSPIELRDVELKQPGTGEILVKVRACGVCFTDVAVQQGGMGDVFPRIPGHEIVGDVVAIGDGVRGFSLGQRVGGAWLGGEHHSIPFQVKVY